MPSNNYTTMLESQWILNKTSVIPSTGYENWIPETKEVAEQLRFGFQITVFRVGIKDVEF